MLEKIGKMWKAHPDQRLGQLVMNYIFGNIGGSHTAYIFYKEDDISEAILDEMLETET